MPPGFLIALGETFDVSLNWLLTGRGPTRRAEVVAMSLDRAGASELLTELGARIDERDSGGC